MKYSMKISFASTVSEKEFESVLKITYEPIENQPFIIDAGWFKGITGAPAYSIELVAKSFERTWEVSNKYTEKSFVFREGKTKKGYPRLTIIFKDSFGSFNGFFNPEPVND